MQYAIKITTVKIKYIIFQLSHLLVICRIMNFMSYVLEGKCIRVNRTIFFINNLKILYLQINKWIINSVGSECHVDNVEVTGSNPVWSTDRNSIIILIGFFCLCG